MTKRNHDLLRNVLDEPCVNADLYRCMRALRDLDEELVAIRPGIAMRGRSRELSPRLVRCRGLVPTVT